MSALMVAFRLVHVICGALWVGMVVFTTWFLMPAVRDAGPDGGKVLAALQRRGIMTLMPALAIATLVSGLGLYWRVSGNLGGNFATSPTGLAFGIGGVSAIVAYLVGIIVMRPAMMRSAALLAGMGATPGAPDTAGRMEEVGRLRARGAAAGRVVATLLLVSVALMAVARYL